MTDLPLIALVTIIFLLAIAVAAFLHRKHRLIWREIWELRKVMSDSRSHDSHEFESAFKQLAKSRFTGEPRLQLMLPSQHGEDVLLWNYFGRKTSGCYLEIGAFDGVKFSNTYFFEAIGWSGILVESVPEFCDRARKNRPFSKVVNVAVGGKERDSVIMQVAEGDADYIGAFSFVGDGTERDKLARVQARQGRVRAERVACTTLDAIASELRDSIDFITVDVEGLELEILESFSLGKFEPQVLVVEDNSHGVDKRVSELLCKNGYVEKYRRGPNVFYARLDDDREFSWA